MKKNQRLEVIPLVLTNNKGVYMKLTMLSVDWKDDFDGNDITQAIKDVGGKRIVYNHDQDNADDKIMYFSSHPLTSNQLKELWEKGDFYTGDRVWSGKNFKDIINKIEKYIIRELERETK